MQQIGRYEILEEIGRGAMGAVFKARDPQIGRVVAIKVILCSNLTPDDLKHYKERFLREAQTAGQMSHPGIVTIHDISEDKSGQPFIVMEFVEGRTLEKMLQPGAKAPAGEKTESEIELPSAQPRLLTANALDIGIQLAEALDYAHKRNVIHRDIKPSNILITAEGRAKILDFGIAKIVGSSMTQTGMMMGTPAFMSPEQVSASPIDHRSDLFSLGGVLYWMFTGEKPFPGESLTSITFKIAFSQPLPANYLNRALPSEIDIVLSRCLAKKADDRYASAQELADDLRAIKEGRPVKATHAPAADVTSMQETAPLHDQAAGLPPEQRAAQSAAGQTISVTGRPGGAPEQTAQPAPAAAPAASTSVAAVPAAEPPRKKSRAILYALCGVLGMAVLMAAIFSMTGSMGGGGTEQFETVQPGTSAPPTQPPAPESQPVPSTPAGSSQSAVKESSAAPAAGKPAQSQSNTSRTGAPKSLQEQAAAEPPTIPSEKQPTGSALAPTATAASVLEIEINHNFKEAEIEVIAGTRRIYQAALTDKAKNVSASVQVPAGQHVLRVRVKSERDKFDQEKETGGIFRESEKRKLTVGFGRGSGIGFRERNLDVKLSDSVAIKP
jgi:serine/threonine-protein kinase